MSALLLVVFLLLLVVSFIALVPGLSSVRVALSSFVSSRNSSLHLSSCVYASVFLLVGVFVSAALDYRTHSASNGGDVSAHDRHRLVESERDMILSASSVSLLLLIWTAFQGAYDVYRADVQTQRDGKTSKERERRILTANVYCAVGAAVDVVVERR